MGGTTAQVGGLYQGGQRYWDILRLFSVLVFVIEIWEIAKLYWDILRKYYFGEKNFTYKF